ncbi:hypothetical protein TNCV_2845111 [Trichonephila clavipes]|nr:hypothetical protein TNCV_2845111 [Trichonephila clavipes]
MKRRIEKWVTSIESLRSTALSHAGSPEKFVVVDDDNERTSPITADKDILESVQSSKNIIDADSDEENEINNAAPDPVSSEMRNTVKKFAQLLKQTFQW